jgi:hypothetical protein
MAGFLDIKQGGRIRYNAVAAIGQTWLRGQCVVINSNEQLELLGANNFVSGSSIGGPALEQCLSQGSQATGGNVIQNTAIVFAGNTGSVLLGEAVVITDNLSGTGGWTPGLSPVYAQIGGNYSYNSASGLQVGRALRNPQASGKLEFLYIPPMGN